MIHLKDKLITITRGSLSVTDFLTSIKQIADELTALGDPPSDVDLLIYVTRGLRPAYKELITAIRTRDTVAPFEELFDKIIDHETFLLQQDKQHPEPEPPTANLAKHFPSPQKSFRPKPSSNTRPLFPTPPHTAMFTPPPGFSPTSNPTICQYCNKPNHTANRCYKLFPHPDLSVP
ncbi:uncharacterized protein [Henckelia pumila]|uniref:uncharacterized protein n=1 Tax=Henckelia pumila TaxID=405737 RepID=UPI003C6E67E4